MPPTPWTGCACESMVDKDLEVDTSDLHIDIEVDKEQRTLTVRDNGIGMSRDDVVQLIGTIAKSGTADVLRKLKESQDAAASSDLIGQFGVGFYSTFMVADKVTLVTRRAGESEGTRWESTGEGTYVIEPVEDLPQGTAVTVHLKPEDVEDQLFDYTAEWKIREIVKRYSDFIAWPIRMTIERTVDDENDHRGPDPQLHEGAVGAIKGRGRRGRVQRVLQAHQPRLDRSPRDHPHEGRGDVRVRGPALHPVARAVRPVQREGRRGVQLHVKRVFIMDDCEALMPHYLRFVKGVVDAHDLSLNLSREILQRDRQIQVVRRRLVRKVLSTVKDDDGQPHRSLPDVLDRVRPGGEGGSDRGSRQPRDHPRYPLRPVDPRPGPSDDPAPVRGAHEGRAEGHLLPDRRVG